MSDCISRQEALDEWNRLSERGRTEFDQVLMTLPSARPEPSTEIQEILEYLDTTLHPIVSPDNWYVYAELHDMVSMLPSAQPEQHWIPCSERLPENAERVLATTAWGDVTIAERIYPPIDDTCWFIHDGNTNATIDDVVAYMSLPEPYKEEG